MTKTTEIYKRIKDIKLEENSDIVIFVFDDDTKMTQYHEQDCCESVLVGQVDSDPQRFIGAEMYTLQEKTEIGELEYGDTYTYTFYTAVTSKGYLDWRWTGTSNGYYSESVQCKLKGVFVEL
jgi:CRISPR/Cas system-associated protein Csm6